METMVMDPLPAPNHEPLDTMSATSNDVSTGIEREENNQAEEQDAPSHDQYADDFANLDPADAQTVAAAEALQKRMPASPPDNKQELGDGGWQPHRARDDPFPYRHFHPMYPVCNKLLAHKWYMVNREKHLEKLANIKPTVDNGPPKFYPHLQLKLKKLQMEEDRQGQIERDNRILMQKMIYIMKAEAHDPAIHASPRRPGECHTNIGKRQREIERINRENLELLHRLETKEPFYNHIEFFEDRRQHLIYLQNISEYPSRYMHLREQYERARPHHLHRGIGLAQGRLEELERDWHGEKGDEGAGGVSDGQELDPNPHDERQTANRRRREKAGGRLEKEKAKKRAIPPSKGATKRAVAVNKDLPPLPAITKSGVTKRERSPLEGTAQQNAQDVAIVRHKNANASVTSTVDADGDDLYNAATQIGHAVEKSLQDLTADSGATKAEISVKLDIPGDHHSVEVTSRQEQGMVDTEVNVVGNADG